MGFVQDVEALIAEERAAYEAAAAAKAVTPACTRVDLDMRIKIVDGDAVIADTEADAGDFLATCAKFEEFVRARKAAVAV